MKRLLLMAALTMGASACVDGNEPIMILGTTPVGPDCAPLSGPVPLSGRLVVGTDTFITSFNIASSLPAKTGASGERNDFYGEELILSYRTENQKPAINFEDESLPISFFIPVGGASNVLVLDVIGNAAKVKIKGVPRQENPPKDEIPGMKEGSTLFVTVKLKGKTSAGGSVESNEATYPIQIVGVCENSPTAGDGACSNPNQC
ncbi:hypothetical protein [Stigmatella hybrida]|uniref:hypothetical protein n=1 Tax=Stigmatella hybrida TaxID=394097 RepID=UPI001CDAA178|nr:hypothetical protein [Stigmatella hybrida]